MKNREYNQADGVLLVDKPADWTSFDVVNFVRRHFNLKKTGHCGTLDPFATGLLIVLCGKATRLQDALMGQDKVYTGTMRLGVRTDSQDLTGQVVQTTDVPAFTQEALQEAANRFVGEIEQLPPMHSAIKIDGKPLYKLARQGKEVERQPRPVRIDAFQLTALRLPDVDFLVRCSKGTYIRTLAADLGDALGTGAHLTALRRQASGNHDVKDAASLDVIRTWDIAALREHLQHVGE